MFKIALIVVVSFGCVWTEPQAKQNIRLAPDKTAQILQIALQCVSETGVDPAILVQIKDRKYSNDENVKKFFFCAFKKTGLTSKKGLIKVDKMLDVYPDSADKEALRKVIEECNKSNSTEPMDKVYTFFQCFQKNTPVHVTLRD